MFWKKYFLPVMLFVLTVLLLAGIGYVAILRTWAIPPPAWLAWIIPGLVSVLLLTFTGRRWFVRIALKPTSRWLSTYRLYQAMLLLALPFIVIVLFKPMAESLRFNFGQVKVLASVHALKPHEEAVFLELSDWYADRMRVIPIHTFKKLPGWFRPGKIQVNSLFIVPIFSRDDAYRTHARAWLAFHYSDRMTAKDFSQGGDRDFYRSAMIHFKRRNIREFRYLEAFPRGEEYRQFQNMARVHHFFKKGFSGIYQGQDVDRDVMSAYYGKYALFLFALIGLPAMLALSALLRLLTRR